MPYITEKRGLDEVIRLHDFLSPRVDGISIRQIFDSRPLLASLFNVIIETGVYPSEWKKTLIKPIPKVPPPSKASDMHPITLQNMHSKIFDGIFVEEISTFFQKSGFLVDKQFEFSESLNTDTAVLDLVENIRIAIEARDVYLAFFIDFSVAFNCIHPT